MTKSRPAQGKPSLAVCTAVNTGLNPGAVDKAERNEAALVETLRHIERLGVNVTWVVGGDSLSLSHIDAKAHSHRGLLSRARIGGVTTEIRHIDHGVGTTVIQNTLACATTSTLLAFVQAEDFHPEDLLHLVDALLKNPGANWAAASGELKGEPELAPRRSIAIDGDVERSLHSVVMRRAAWREFAGLPADLDIAGTRAMLPLLAHNGSGVLVGSNNAITHSPLSRSMKQRMDLLRDGIAWSPAVNRVSVITAVHARYLPLLSQAYDTVLHQGGNTQVEWCVQLDGVPTVDQQKELKKFQALTRNGKRVEISYGENGSQQGVAVTRNKALERATGDVVIVLDSDDLLHPATTEFVARHLSEHPNVGWMGLGIHTDIDIWDKRDLNPNRLFGFAKGSINSGKNPRNSSFFNTKGDYNTEFLFVARTDLVRLLGGWSALPTEEDFSLLHAVGAISDGAVQLDGIPFRIRRHWAGQLTAMYDLIDRAEPLHRSARSLSPLADLVGSHQSLELM